MKNKSMPKIDTVVESTLPGEQEVEIENPNKSDSEQEIKVPVTGNKSIEVVATRKGFYNQRRIREGMKFKVKSFKELGEWMECVDPEVEKKRKETLKKKKAKK